MSCFSETKMAEGGESLLTDEETEKLLHFQELTGIDNFDECRQLLTANGWDLEVAVQFVLSRQDGRQSAFHESPQVNQREPQVNVDQPEARTLNVERAGTAPRGVQEWIVSVLQFPYYLIYSIIFGAINFLFSLFRPDPRLNVVDPLGDVMAFVNAFNQKYGPVRPNFHEGTYGEALTIAKQDLLFMLVYLQDEKEPELDNYCRLTLCDQRVVNLIRHRTIVWGCSVNSPEGFRVSRALKATHFPFLSVIVLRNGRMTVVQRIQGLIGAHDLLPALARVFDHNEEGLEVVRQERMEQFLNQSLRRQQDEAYEVSLRADQEKDRKKREQVESERRAAEEEQNRDLDIRRRRQETEQRKDLIRQFLPPEPEPSDPDAITVVLKLPNGVRLERRFNKTDSMSVLYDYLFVHEAAPDDFQVVTNFPRKVLPCQPTQDNPVPPTFAEFGLHKAELLFVHDNQA